MLSSCPMHALSSVCTFLIIAKNICVFADSCHCSIHFFLILTTDQPLSLVSILPQKYLLQVSFDLIFAQIVLISLQRILSFLVFFFLLSFSLSSISNNWLSCPHESALLEALLAHPHVPINSPLDPKYQAEGSSLSEPGFSLSPSATCTSTQFPSPSATAQIQVSSPLSTCSHLLMGFLPLRPSPIRVHSPQLLTK